MRFSAGSGAAQAARFRRGETKGNRRACAQPLTLHHQVGPEGFEPPPGCVKDNCATVDTTTPKIRWGVARLNRCHRILFLLIVCVVDKATSPELPFKTASTFPQSASQHPAEESNLVPLFRRQSCSSSTPAGQIIWVVDEVTSPALRLPATSPHPHLLPILSGSGGARILVYRASTDRSSV